jgi:uncharacterized MnhB-related membrane protein
VLLSFLAITAIAVVRLRDLFAVVMLFGIFSLLSAAIFVTLDAVDVAFTEAAVGAGIATVLMLAPCSRCWWYASPVARWCTAPWICRVSAIRRHRYTSMWRHATSRIRLPKSDCPMS